MNKFMVLSLPRSRSFWLSHFLSHGAYECAHDLLVSCGSIEEFANKLASYDGTCETAAMVGWRLIVHRWPQMRLVVVKRPIDEVIDSILEQGFQVERSFLEEREHMLDSLSSLPGVKTYSFASLEEQSTCKEIFEFCLQEPFDLQWWEELRNIDLQIDFKARVQLIGANALALNALHAEVLLESSKLESKSCPNLN